MVEFNLLGKVAQLKQAVVEVQLSQGYSQI